MLLVSDIYS